MSKAKRWALGASALILVGAAAYYFASRGGRQAQAPVMAPDFTYPDLKGHKVALSSFRGKVVLLDFWATWCGPCQEEVPDLKKLHAHYKDKGFAVVGVAMDTLGEAVAPFVKANGIDYPILVSGGEPPEGYPIVGFPTAFLIDRNGLVVARYVGEMGYEDFAKDVEDALAR